MEPIMRQVLGKIPPVTNNQYQAYCNAKLAIFNPKVALAARATFDCYQFVIPYTKFPATKIDEKKFLFDCNKVFPVNHGQHHGCQIDENTPSDYLAIFIDKPFVQQLAQSIYKKSDVFFINDNHRVDSDLYHTINLFIHEVRNAQPGYEFILDGLGTQMVVQMLRSLKTNLPALIKEKNYSARESIDRVIEFLHANYCNDYSLEYISNSVNLSPYHFIRVFKKHTGKTPYEFLTELKIEKAREMLLSRRFTITEVCFKCGFGNLSHFTTVFRKKTGTSPSEYRRIILGE